jgi:hypothetical protein
MASPVPPGDVPEPGTPQADTALGQPPSPDPKTAPVQSASNQSPALPANAQAAAAKVHAYLGHAIDVLQQAQSEVEKYVPAELLVTAERDVKAFVQSLVS